MAVPSSGLVWADVTSETSGFSLVGRGIAVDCGQLLKYQISKQTEELENTLFFSQQNLSCSTEVEK